jgi:hypothetical protein
LAPDETLKNAIDRAMKAGGVGWPLNDLPKKELPKLLGEGELPEQIVRGHHVDLGASVFVVATNKRLLFLQESGVLVKRAAVTSISYERIDAVQQRTGLAFGEVTVSTAGAAARIDKIENKRVGALANLIREKVDGAKSGPRPTEVSPATQLAQFAELHKQGVLTDDEFAAKKKQLLGL